MKTEFTPGRTNAEAQRTQRSAEADGKNFETDASTAALVFGAPASGTARSENHSIEPCRRPVLRFLLRPRFLRASPRPPRLCVSPLLAALLLGVLAFIPSAGRAATNDLTALLQQGLFEEQANRNLDAAIASYQSLAAQFDKDRQFAATAVFRLGECYRALGKTNEAVAQYNRVLRDFADQTTLATLSRQNLTGLGMAQTDNEKATERSGQASAEARSLAAQISGIEQLKSEPEEQARAALAIFPDEDLKKMLLNMPGLRFQENLFRTNAELAANVNANPTVHPAELDKYVCAIGGKSDVLTGLSWSGTNGLDVLGFTQNELRKQIAWMSERVDFIVGIQKARLKVLQSAEGFMAAPIALRNDNTAVVPDDEDLEIRRIQQMMQNSPDLINARGDAGTPLAKAATKGWLKVATYLMDHGADVNGSLALSAAVASGNRAMVELLLSRGAKVSAMDDSGRTLLHTAVRKGYQSVAEVLLANKADVNAQDDLGNSPLASATENGQVKMIQLLLAAGANPNLMDKHGQTPFSLAAMSGSPEIVKLFLAAKADPNGSKMNAPLLAAIYKKDAASVELLLQAGADANAKGQVHWSDFSSGYFIEDNFGRGWATPLWLAIRMNQLPMVQLLLKFKADPNDSQTDRKPLLFGALSDTNLLEILLAAGANVDPMSPDQFEWTPLAAAVSQNNFAAAAILLKHGANPNARSRNGVTPLHWAAYGFSERKIFELLLANKADPNVRSINGETPLDSLKKFQVQNTFPAGIPVPGRAMPAPGRNVSPEQIKLAGELADLLRQHGALDKLPDWDRITVSRPADDFSDAVFGKATNGWNHFTLLELIGRMGGGNIKQLRFPDLARIIIARPGANGAATRRIEINLLNAANSIEYSKDVPLEFGDVVEIPERGHTLADQDTWFSDALNKLDAHLREQSGAVRLVVAGGQTIQMPLKYFPPPGTYISSVLSHPDALQVLTSTSDLSRVKVTRSDLKTNKTDEWILECSKKNGLVPVVSENDLLLRDGDVLEVPQKR